MRRITVDIETFASTPNASIDHQVEVYVCYYNLGMPFPDAFGVVVYDEVAPLTEDQFNAAFEQAKLTQSLTENSRDKSDDSAS